MVVLSNFLTENGRVVPGKAQVWIGSVPAQYPQRFRSLVVIVQEDVTLGPFHQCQYIYVLCHSPSSPKAKRRALNERAGPSAGGSVQTVCESY